jgi:hypothetical protein
MDPRNFAISLLNLDDEVEVQKLLVQEGYWNDPSCWRPLGDVTNNSGTIGSQQSDAFAALTEKLTNSIDEVILQACRLAGVDPTGPDAPKDLSEAITRFGLVKGVGGDGAGAALLDWISRGVSDQEVLALARKICVSITGPRGGMPSVSIADQGGGQTPDAIPHTFMSLHKGNKINIPFVQGKFNMGGTGALRFCSQKNHFQLVITRRNPALLGDDASPRDLEWGFTIVRKREPLAHERASVYEYLAPVKGDDVGSVLSFAAEALPIFPSTDERQAYGRDVEFGTVIKLYQYEWDTAMASRSMAVRSKSVLTQLNCSLPGAALPIRLNDCRGFEGHSNSYNVLGLRGWLECQIDQSKLELECPVTGRIHAGGYEFPVRAYVFSYDEKNQQTYKANYGVIFSVNGQRHAHKEQRFFSNKSIGLPRIASKLVVVVECDQLDAVGMEEMFMSSRDRLANTEITREVETELASWLHNNPVLKEIQARHLEAELAKRLGEDLPIADIFKNLLRSNPALADVFKNGTNIKAPNLSGGGRPGTNLVFDPKQFPTYFRFFKHDDSYQRVAPLGCRVHIDFETDVANDYFSRRLTPGSFSVEFEGGRQGSPSGSLGTLQNGAVRFDMTLPNDVHVGEIVKVKFVISDPTQMTPFVNVVDLEVVAARKPSGGGSSSGRTNPNTGKGTLGSAGAIDLPRIELISKESWPPNWDDETCLEAVLSDGKPELYRVNADNKHLIAAIRRDPKNCELIKRKFELASALLATSVVINEEAGLLRLGDAAAHIDLECQVSYVTSVVAQMLLPMVDALGRLTLNDLDPSSDY